MDSLRSDIGPLRTERDNLSATNDRLRGDKERAEARNRELDAQLAEARSHVAGDDAASILVQAPSLPSGLLKILGIN